MMQELAPVNWTAIGVIVSIVSIITSGIITLAVLYLKMFINGALTAMETKIMFQIEAKFPQKVVVDIQIADHERRLGSIENKMEVIRSQKQRDDGQ